MLPHVFFFFSANVKKTPSSAEGLRSGLVYFLLLCFRSLSRWLSKQSLKSWTAVLIFSCKCLDTLLSLFSRPRGIKQHWTMMLLSLWFTASNYCYSVVRVWQKVQPLSQLSTKHVPASVTDHPGGFGQTGHMPQYIYSSGFLCAALSWTPFLFSVFLILDTWSKSFTVWEFSGGL